MINEIEINSDRFAQVRNARNTETAEDYTEMIADLIRETGEARAVDLAKHFGVTGPTVNSIIRRLVREGLVESRPYRSIFLTEKGKLLADYCKKRHEIVYNFLIKIGVPPTDLKARTGEFTPPGMSFFASSNNWLLLL